MRWHRCVGCTTLRFHWANVFIVKFSIPIYSSFVWWHWKQCQHVGTRAPERHMALRCRPSNFCVNPEVIRTFDIVKYSLYGNWIKGLDLPPGVLPFERYSSAKLCVVRWGHTLVTLVDQKQMTDLGVLFGGVFYFCINHKFSLISYFFKG